MSEITTHDVMTHWPVGPPLRLEPIAMGTNNRSYLVKTDRHTYVLKSYRNRPSQDRLGFEHELLDALQELNLPFAIPVTIPAKSGDIRVRLHGDHVSLFNVIPGRPAKFGCLSITYQCGEALAILDDALNTVTLAPSTHIPMTFGDFSTIHPLIPNLQGAIEGALADYTLAREVCLIMSMVSKQWPYLTDGWSTQIIHSDFYPTNTMMDSGIVTGILDFEFAGLGYRAMDFSTGLSAFSIKDWNNDECFWPLLESFARGYMHRSPLPEQHLSAMPVLILMRELISFVHWLGRLEQGLTTRVDIADRAHRVVAVDAWIQRNQDQLVHRLRIINSP